MKARRTIAFAAALLVAAVAESGHELPVYPSYYPHEIEIKTIAPGEAAAAMRAGNLHAYVGANPVFAPNPPKPIDAVVSLGSLVVVRLNPDAPLARDGACAAAQAIVRDLAARSDAGGFTFHPYPVTPWHGDYLNHVDLAADARQRILAGRAPPPADFKVHAGSGLAGRLVRSEWLAEGPLWDAAIEEIDVSGLVADATTAMNGWLGPRWVRSGWFHAERALGGSLQDPAEKQKLAALVARLQAADYQTAVERINLERDLVQLLASGCRTMVAGYTAKREFFNADFSAGIENISFDALDGFSSPMFLRTVKLKDFPWNGSLQLGIATPPSAAWNPVAGFTDRFGRLAWYAIADPAAVPSPYEAGWTLNRISEVDMAPRQ
jgi:hypothetical protein